MQGFELEDLTLWLIRDAGEDQMWIDRWAISYPVVQMSEASAGQSIGEWQAGLRTAFERIRGKYVAVVAHGAGAAAFLAWLYQADILTRKKIANIILVPQRPDIFPDDAEHTFQRVRCPCRAALVVPEHG
ncbi:TPA: alpha/beta hydrolase, partial [Neisseria meningitidis]